MQLRAQVMEKSESISKPPKTRSCSLCKRQYIEDDELDGAEGRTKITMY